MFELQDSKGNRFAITRGGSRKSSKTLSGSGSTLQIKRLLRNCNNLALVRAYSYFFSGKRATIKPLAPNAAKSNNDQTLVFETQALEANDAGKAHGLPTAKRASAERHSREQQLFAAIASGELQLTQTYVAQAFDISKAEKALGLSRSRLLSELNAIALNEQTTANKLAATAPKQQSSNPQTKVTAWGASTHSGTTPSPSSQIIQQQYRRFVASLPQVVKTESTSAVTAPTGTSEVQSREMIKALGFSPNKVSSSQFQQANQLASAIWRDKGLYKTLTQFSDAYTSAQSPSSSSNKSSATNDATNYELALTLLLCHNQDPHSLSSPSARQIELFPRFKSTGRNLWETAEASRALNAEKLTTAGKNSKASFSDLAAEDAKVREKTTPAPVITFIEIQLLDDKGEPVANEPYWIKDPEGNEHTGSTDGSGKARVDGIRSGNCQVAFPEIEGSGVQQCSAGVDCCTPAEVEPELAWAEFALEDDDGNPIANEDYVLVCPEGNEYKGTTDAMGTARVEGIQPGFCSVTFPNRDSSSINRAPAGDKTKAADSTEPQKTSEHQKSVNESNSETQSSNAANLNDSKSSTSNTLNADQETANKQATKDDDVCGTCSADALATTCSHSGRKANSSGVLQIVPSPDITKTCEISMMGVKVSAKSEYGGKDKITGTLSLAGNKFDSCYQLSTASGTWESTKTASVEIEGSASTESGKWLAKATPTKTKISGKGCSGAPKTTTIECYPNTTYTVEGNLDIFKDWVEKVNKAWGDWGKKIFDVSPVSLTPKLTGPTGSFSGAWGWKEDKDWKTYYDVALSFGLNPIMEVGIELSCSMTKLAGTSAGIPPSISALAAEHIADIIVFAGAGCKGTLLGSPHVKLYPDGNKTIDGEAKFNVEGKVTLGIRGRIGSDYIASATLVMSGETKVIGEDVLGISRDGVELQTTISVEPFTAVAKVEVKYLVIFSKSKEKKWTPWDKFDLYKSEPKKLIG